jgi:phosphoribosyl 1,2-cyclic phosphate phosphodiesterase
LKEIERIGPKRAFLTHMCHDLEYHELAAVLPEGVAPAYDGLEVEVPLYR